MTRAGNLQWIHPDAPPDAFPHPDTALNSPEGLLAAGGDLSPARLLAAYARGIFPWYEQGQPILWWSPNPRAVLYPQDLHVSRSLAKTMRSGRFQVTFNEAFEAVVQRCAAPRDAQGGTWITDEMNRAYVALHRLGHAHSVEVWRDDRLAGGLYGVALGRVFFGESMFSAEANGSKVALVQLVRRMQARDLALVDCQLPSAHLSRMGSRLISRHDFLHLLGRYCPQEAEDITPSKLLEER